MKCYIMCHTKEIDVRCGILLFIRIDVVNSVNPTSFCKVMFSLAMHEVVSYALLLQVAKRNKTMLK